MSHIWHSVIRDHVVRPKELGISDRVDVEISGGGGGLLEQEGGRGLQRVRRDGQLALKHLGAWGVDQLEGGGADPVERENDGGWLRHVDGQVALQSASFTRVVSAAEWSSYGAVGGAGAV